MVRVVGKEGALGRGGYELYYARTRYRLIDTRFCADPHRLMEAIPPCNQRVVFYPVCIVLTINRSFYPTTSVHRVSVLIICPREIQILRSQAARQSTLNHQLNQGKTRRYVLLIDEGEAWARPTCSNSKKPKQQNKGRAALLFALFSAQANYRAAYSTGACYESYRIMRCDTTRSCISQIPPEVRE